MLCYNVAYLIELLPMKTNDPFASAFIGRGAWYRLLIALAVLGPLWLAVLWAVALP